MTINNNIKPEDHNEIEVKIAINDTDELKTKLLGLGFISASLRSLERNIIYDTSDKTLEKKGSIIRLREYDNHFILTFKKPGEESEQYKIKKETEVRISSFTKMDQILINLGYQRVFVYEKFREIFRKADILVMIDETPIGDFLEIEGSTQDIDRIAAELGFSKDVFITDNYLNLYNKTGGSGSMLFTAP